MSDTDQPGRHDAGQGDTIDPIVPGETPSDPAYAAGAGFSGEAAGTTPPEPDIVPTAGPDPLGGDAAPVDPADGGDHGQRPQDRASASAGYAAAAATTSARPGEDDRVLVIVTHAANIAGMFTGGLGNVVALVLAYVKKDTAPDWAHSHYALAIRTVWIALAAAIALIVLAIIAVPLSLVGVGLLMFPLIGLASVALMIWVIARSAVALAKALRDEPYPNPETWLI